MMNQRKRRDHLVLLAAAFVVVAAGCNSQGGAASEDLGTTQQAIKAVDSPQIAVQKVAQSQLMELLNAIPVGAEENYGFNSREEFAEAKLTTPYEMFSTDGTGTVAALEEWRVPVVVGDDFRMLIDVRKSGSTYAAVGIGAAQLASELGQVERATATGSVAQPSQNKSILRAFKQTADFVVYDLDPRQPQNKGQLKIMPLKSAQHSLADKADRIRSTGKALNASKGTGKSNELTMSEVQALLAD
jgi:hypothetical protein